MPTRYRRLARWWHAPVTRGERLRGAVIGGLGLFWITGLGRLMLGGAPIALDQLLAWALAGLLCGTLFGARCPRLAHCLLLPFSLFGFGAAS